MSIPITVKLDSRALAVFLDRVSEKNVRKAVSRALDRTLVTIKKEAAKEVRSGLNLPIGEIKKLLPVRKETGPSKPIDQQRVILLAAAQSISLSKFKPSQGRAGVKVNITGKRETIPHAFMAKMPNAGGSSVFIRTKFIHPGTQSRRVYAAAAHGRQKGHVSGSELPITKMAYVGLHKALEKVIPRLIPIAEQRFQSEFNRTFDYLVSK